MARRPVDELVDRYLARLKARLRDLPASQRRQILQDVADHIAAARRDLDPGDEAGVRAVLERLGDPEAIAAEAGARPPSPTARRDAWVPWLLLLGGFAFGVGWLAGLALLWTSDTWRLPEKLLGTLVLPGGWFGVVVAAGWSGSTRVCGGSAGPGHPAAVHCVTSGFSLPWPAGIAVLLACLIAPLVTAFRLDRARRARPATPRV